VFQWPQEVGGIAESELRRTFNCGIGFVLIASPKNAGAVLAALELAGETAFVCGNLATRRTTRRSGPR
jgi:phosphoribosylformylglycinamidine cyclo-ligase